MKVKAKRLGNETYSCYHGTEAHTMRRYKPGEIFEIADEPKYTQEWADAKLNFTNAKDEKAIRPGSKREKQIKGLVGMPAAFDPMVMEVVDENEEISPAPNGNTIPGAPPQIEKGPVAPPPAGAPPAKPKKKKKPKAD